jgi:hypothetical protein
MADETKKYPLVTITYVSAEWHEDATLDERKKDALQGVDVVFETLYQSDIDSYGKAYSVEFLTDQEIFERTGGLIDICASTGECEEEDDEEETSAETYDYCPTPIIPALDRAEENATGKEED